MTLKPLVRFLMTALIFILTLAIGYALWHHYMYAPWTRNGRVRANIINVAPDISAQVIEVSVVDNQQVRKGDILLRLDPEYYQIAVDGATALASAKRAELRMRKQEAARRSMVDGTVVSRENRENAGHLMAVAQAELLQAQAQLARARLDLRRTEIRAPVNGYVTNLNTHAGDYGTAGRAALAIVDSDSFWVYGYFEETKLPYLHVGDPVEVRMMDGEGVLTGHIESVSRAISDRDNSTGPQLLADVNPIFSWVRLAQRVPVRIHLDEVPQSRQLLAGTTCTVVVNPRASRALHVVPQ